MNLNLLFHVVFLVCCLSSKINVIFFFTEFYREIHHSASLSILYNKISGYSFFVGSEKWWSSFHIQWINMRICQHAQSEKIVHEQERVSGRDGSYYIICCLYSCSLMTTPANTCEVYVYMCVHHCCYWNFYMGRTVFSFFLSFIAQLATEIKQIVSIVYSKSVSNSVAVGSSDPCSLFLLGESIQAETWLSDTEQSVGLWFMSVRDDA